MMVDDRNRLLNSDRLVCTPAQCREACGGTTMGTCAYPHPSEVEAARLRAALGKLADPEVARWFAQPSYGTWVRKVAREALNGGADA